MGKPTSQDQIAAWKVPYRGVIRTVAPHEIPGDALFDSDNVVHRDGFLRTRPGLRRIVNSLDPGSPLPIDPNPALTPGGGPGLTNLGVPTGAFNYWSHLLEPRVIVGTSTAVLSFDGQVWKILSFAANAVGSAPVFPGIFHGDIDHGAQFTSIKVGAEAASRVYLFHTNGVDRMWVWDGVQPNGQFVAGDPVGPLASPGPNVDPPIFTDIATSGGVSTGRIIGIVPPYTVRWSNAPQGNNAPNQWPNLNQASVDGTPDPLVAISPIGTLGGALYKTDTIWIFRFIGGDDASAFAFEFRGAYEGPASPAAIVNVYGTHYYMTRTGRIGAFNGSQHIWVGDGIWPVLRNIIDPTKSNRAFGVYDPYFHEIEWYFPQLTDTDGLPRGTLAVSLPRPEAFEPLLGTFRGHLAPKWGGAVTAGTSYRFADRVPKVFLAEASNPRSAFNRGSADNECTPDGIPIGEGKDAGEPFDWFFQTGLQPAPGMDMHRVSAVEPLIERNTNFGQITFQPVRSYALAVRGGELGDAVTVDLEQRQPRPLEGADIRGRFFGGRFSFNPVAQRTQLVPGQLQGPEAPTLRYNGLVFFGHPTEGGQEIARKYKQ